MIYTLFSGGQSAPFSYLVSKSIGIVMIDVAFQRRRTHLKGHPECTNSYIAFMAAVFGFFILSSSLVANDEQGPDYTELAERYAEAMVQHGRDSYGHRKTPLFVTQLDRKTMELADNPKERWPIRREETGIRNIDRNFNAANPLRHRALHRLLIRISERKNEEKWARVSDQSFAWILEHAQHPETGLLAWGEHLGWRVDRDRPVRHQNSSWGDRKHEIWHDLPWKRLYGLNRKAAYRYAEGMWEYHVYDKEKGLHAHQTRWDTYAPDKGYVFPRMHGHLVLAFSWAHKHAPDQKARRQWVKRINLLSRHHEGRRHPITDAVQRQHPTAKISIRFLMICRECLMFIGRFSSNYRKTPRTV